MLGSFQNCTGIFSAAIYQSSSMLTFLWPLQPFKLILWWTRNQLKMSDVVFLIQGHWFKSRMHATFKLTVQLPIKSYSSWCQVTMHHYFWYRLKHLDTLRPLPQIKIATTDNRSLLNPHALLQPPPLELSMQVVTLF